MCTKKSSVKRKGHLAFEVVTVPFGFVMEFLFNIVDEFCVARVARQSRHISSSSSSPFLCFDYGVANLFEAFK